MDQTRKKNINRGVALACAATLVAFLAAMPLLAGTDADEDGPQASILSGTVENRTIETVVVGGGTLTEADAVAVSVPSAVKLTKFLVQNGDAVTAGTPIAAVDRVTVMTAIAEVQETLDHLAQELEAERETENPGEVTALAGGVVKSICAQPGDSVADVMLEHGALAVLSLDGLMAVELTAATDLTAGSTVTVTLADGTAVEGTVESNLAGTLVVTLADDGYEADQTVQVSTEDGADLGSGALYIHSPWNAVAYTGIVEELEVSVGDEVDPGDTLMELTDTGRTAAYQQLVAQRQEYEELMLELFTLYQTEQLTAPCDGVVSGVDEESLQLLREEEGYVLTLLANAPNGDDETLYTNYLGQVTALGEAGWELLLDTRPLEIADYLDLTGVEPDAQAMTEAVTYDPSPAEGAPTPIYEQTEGVWQQIDAETVVPGDVLLFAGDAEGRIVWIVRITRAEEAPEPETPTEPTAPSDPTEPAEPTEPVESTQPSEPSAPSTGTQPGFSVPSSGGSYSDSYGSVGGAQTAEPEFELYGLETSTVASVTPQEALTIEITADELDISGLTLGQEARITIDALTGQQFTSVITQIANTGVNSGGSSKFSVELTLERSGDMLAGMTATAVIPVAVTGAVPSVPVAALSEEGSQTLIYTGWDEEQELLTDPVAVTLGASDGEYVQILSGLEAGAAYCYAYYDTLEISNIPDFGGGFSFFGR